MPETHGDLTLTPESRLARAEAELAQLRVWYQDACRQRDRYLALWQKFDTLYREFLEYSGPSQQALGVLMTLCQSFVDEPEERP